MYMSTSLNLDLSSSKVCDIILFKVQPYTYPNTLSLSLSLSHKIPSFAKFDEIVLAKLH